MLFDCIGATSSRVYIFHPFCSGFLKVWCSAVCIIFSVSFRASSLSFLACSILEVNSSTRATNASYPSKSPQ